MKKLNIKAMAKDMSFDDRAKLIFANCIKKGETQGRDFVLENGEEEALVDACQRDGRISDLNRLVVLYNLTIFVMADIELSRLQLELIVSRVETFLFSLSARRRRDSKKDGIFLFVKGGGFVPNELLQAVFVRAFEAAKDVQRACLLLDYVMSLAEIDLLGEEDLSSVARTKEVLKNFFELEGVIGVMKIFRDMVQSGIVKRADYKEEPIYDFLNGKMEAVELSEAEREFAKNRIKDLMMKEGYPIT